MNTPFGARRPRLTSPPREFQVTPDVRAAAATWPTRSQVRVDEVCIPCGQVVVPLSADNAPYVYTPEERGSLIVAHLIQRHGWTRESIGERG